MLHIGYEDTSGTIYQGDTPSVLREMASESVDCIITSPPYYGLRDYGESGQIGLEETPEEYIEKLVDVFREARRVLKNDGTLWLNLGDSYSGSGKGPDGKRSVITNHAAGVAKPYTGLPPKNLIGIPWRVALALQADGWILRQDIIWNKPNPMPESVTDRCTKSHEYIFLFARSPRYYFDGEAIKEPVAESSIKRLAQNIEEQAGSDRVPGREKPMKAVIGRANKGYNKDAFNHPQSEQRGISSNFGDFIFRNKRSVWTVTTKPFKFAHFAVFPPDLIEPMVRAGCPVGGTVMDVFMGSGTTALVAKRLNRKYIGIELNHAYIAIAKDRLRQDNLL